MYVDVSKPPLPLPVPKPTTLSPGVTLLPPLSRRGTGPGLILLTPNSEDNLSIINGVPSLLRKWAEEGYTVLEIQSQAFIPAANTFHNHPIHRRLSWKNQVKFQRSVDALDYRIVLKKAVDALRVCEECQPKGKIGVVVYDPNLWDLVGMLLADMEDFVAASVYTSPQTNSEIFLPAAKNFPVLLHITGSSSASSTLQKTPQVNHYAYPSTNSHFFAIPFQPDFNYAAEAVSHTRNLTFMKKYMDGPYFDLEAIWDEHTYFEFENRSVEHTMATMVDEPYVNHVPTMTGGIGREELTYFYTNHFIFSNPPDTELELISRTVGVDRVVDEFIFKLSHTSEIDWLIPGVPPTNKYLEIPMTAIVNIRGDRLYHEHINWDQGTVLSQLGVLPEWLPWSLGATNEAGKDGKKLEFKLPVAGKETAAKMRVKAAVKSNGMFVGGGVREILEK